MYFLLLTTYLLKMKWILVSNIICIYLRFKHQESFKKVNAKITSSTMEHFGQTRWILLAFCMKAQVGALQMGKKALVGIIFGAVFMDLRLMVWPLNKLVVAVEVEMWIKKHSTTIYLSTMVFHLIHMNRYLWSLFDYLIAYFFSNLHRKTRLFLNIFLL